MVSDLATKSLPGPSHGVLPGNLSAEGVQPITGNYALAAHNYMTAISRAGPAARFRNTHIDPSEYVKFISVKNQGQEGSNWIGLLFPSGMSSCRRDSRILVAARATAARLVVRPCLPLAGKGRCFPALPGGVTGGRSAGRR